MIIHKEPHPLAGKTIKVKTNAMPMGEMAPVPVVVDYHVEDWIDRVAGKSWMDCQGNPACLNYAVRSAMNEFPLDDNVLYGKIEGLGHLIHISELMEIPEEANAKA